MNIIIIILLVLILVSLIILYLIKDKDIDNIEDTDNIEDIDNIDNIDNIEDSKYKDVLQIKNKVSNEQTDNIEDSKYKDVLQIKNKVSNEPTQCLISNELGCKLMDGSTIYSKIKNSVVMISVDNRWQGTGFFINSEGYICTAAHVITSTKEGKESTGGLVPANNVYVLVSPTYLVYKCRIVGYDGAGDIGVLKIDENDEYNKLLPSIKNIEYLKFSDDYKTGQLAFVLGYPLGTDISSFSMGIIRNDNFVAPSLFLPFNLVLITSPAYQGNSGSPIVNAKGDVVGLLTFVYYSKEQTYEGIGGGPEKDIVDHVVNKIIEGDKSKSSKYFDKINKKYIKGYLGIGTSRMVWFSDMPNIINKHNFPEARPIGFRGKTSIVKNTDFSKNIKASDIITKINGISIGALPGQKAPGSILWKLLPGDKVHIDYYTLENEKYIKKTNVPIILENYPEELDTFEGRSLKVEIQCTDDNCSLASGFIDIPEPKTPIGF